MLRLVRPDEPPPAEPVSRKRRLVRRGLRMILVLAGLLAALALLWWSATSDQRAIRSLPEAQRLPLLQSTVANLKNVDCFEDISKGPITEVSGGAKQFSLSIASKCP